MTIDGIVQILRNDEYCNNQMRDNDSETGRALLTAIDTLVEVESFYERIKTVTSDYKDISLKDYAKHINGSEFKNGRFLSEQDIKVAKENGFAVVAGYSDDLVNIDGSIHGETDCWIGPDNDKPKRIYIDNTGFTEKETTWYIDVYWCKGCASWEYETNIPCERFKIYSDDELYCIGLVFDVKNVF